MRGFNKVILMGNLGADPEIRYSQAGDPVATLRVATDYRYRDSEGKWAEKAEWHRIVCFKRKAELCRDYLHKGDPILLEGKLRTRKWTDDEGRDHYMTEILVDELTFVGRVGKGGSPAETAATPPEITDTIGYEDDVPF